MKAPTKQRSMKATKMALSRVDLRRTRVTSAQAAARTETMKRTLIATECQCTFAGGRSEVLEIGRSGWLTGCSLA